MEVRAIQKSDSHMEDSHALEFCQGSTSTHPPEEVLPMTKLTAIPDSKLDRQALLLFFGLTICFAAIAYIPIVRSGSLKALGGLALPLLMWSPGFAGIITGGLLFRSVSPLGLGGNSKLLFWAVLCLLLPVAYTLVIYPTLEVFGLVSLEVVS